MREVAQDPAIYAVLARHDIDEAVQLFNEGILSECEVKKRESYKPWFDGECSIVKETSCTCIIPDNNPLNIDKSSIDRRDPISFSKMRGLEKQLDKLIEDVCISPCSHLSVDVMAGTEDGATDHNPLSIL